MIISLESINKLSKNEKRSNYSNMIIIQIFNDVIFLKIYLRKNYYLLLLLLLMMIMNNIMKIWEILFVITKFNNF